MFRLLLRILCVVVSLDVTISGGGSGCRCDCGCEPEIYKGPQYIAAPSKRRPALTTPSPITTEASLTSTPAPTCSPDCETVGNRCYKLVEAGNATGITSYNDTLRRCEKLLCGGTPAIFDDVAEFELFKTWVNTKHVPVARVWDGGNVTIVRLGGMSEDGEAPFITPQGRNYTGLSDFVADGNVATPVCVVLLSVSGAEYNGVQMPCPMLYEHLALACEFGRD